MKTLANSLMSVLTILSFATTAVADIDSMASLEPQVRPLFLNKLKEILPPYIAATDKTLAEIAKPGVSDSTRLSDFYEIFDQHQSILIQSGAFGDVDFAGGRNEEDVAWLKQSSAGLKKLQVVVDQALAGKNVDAKLDKMFNNFNYRPTTNKWGLNLQVSLLATSRFYCNVQIEMNQESGQGILVEAIETCD